MSISELETRESRAVETFPAGALHVDRPLQVLPEASQLGTKRSHAVGRPLGELARLAMSWSTGFWGTLDVVLAASAFAFAHVLSPQFHFATPHGYHVGLGAGVFGALVFPWAYAFGLYDRHSFTSLWKIVGFPIVATAMALACTTLLFSWIGYAQIGRFILLYTLLISSCGMIGMRLGARVLARHAKLRVLFVGRHASFRLLEKEFRRHYREFYYRPVYLDLQTIAPEDRQGQLLATCQRVQPNKIVIEDANTVIRDVVPLAPALLSTGCRIRTYGAYYEEILGQVPVDTLDQRGVLGTGFVIGRCHVEAIKRGLDIALAGLGLTIGLPLMIFCAVMVKLTSPGPVIYSQVRVGRYGRNFKIYKFRTMRTDAEKNGAVWAKTKDSRVTPIGGLLRKSRFDELPQLWNILRGDMSFVGPRPERPEFVADLRRQIPHYDLRHVVPPGLTGWAQVRYRYGASVEDARRKLAYDLYYVRHYSPMFDLGICVRTVVAMAKGAR